MNNTAFTINNQTIHAITYGNAKNPIILALHGWLDNAASFALLAPLLKDYYVISIDLPGHGFTPMPQKDKPLDIHIFVDTLNALIQQLSDQPIILMGHSLGGAVSTIYTAQHPDKVKKLILIDVVGPLSSDMMATNPSLQTNARAMQEAARYASKKTYPSFEAMLAVRMKANHLTAEQAQAMVERGIVQTDNGYKWRFDPIVAQSSAFYYTEAEVLAMLQKITCPVLIIAGDKGIFKGRDFYQQRLNAIQNLTLEFLNGYHHIHLENPNKTADFINQFLIKP